MMHKHRWSKIQRALRKRSEMVVLIKFLSNTLQAGGMAAVNKLGCSINCPTARKPDIIIAGEGVPAEPVAVMKLI